MDNLEKYADLLTEILLIDKKDLNTASTANQPAWDSIGKLNLVAGVEEVFSIELETEDIMNFNSYAQGLEILKKYGIDV